jgi:hypothetical protein
VPNMRVEFRCVMLLLASVPEHQIVIRCQLFIMLLQEGFSSLISWFGLCIQLKKLVV